MQRRPTARNAVLSIAGIFLTIPSLALFALFIPIVGIGNPPAIMALFLYSLLPILRNTVTGLDEVNPAIVEAAKGMGMNSRQQLLKVKLPLAWPVVMAGVRVSSLLVIGIAAIAVLVGETAWAPSSRAASPASGCREASSRSGSARSSPSSWASRSMSSSPLSSVSPAHPG